MGCLEETKRERERGREGRQTDREIAHARMHVRKRACGHTHDTIVGTNREIADRHADTERGAFHVHSSGTPTYY